MRALDESNRRAREFDGYDEESSPPKPQRFPLVKFNDVLLTRTSFYRVKGLLPAYGLVVVWGPPKCGKSFWTFDLLMHVALGWEYRGLRVKAGPVVYCALEGERGFGRRLEAFRRKHPESKDAPFYLMFMSLDLIRDNKALVASFRAQLPEGVQPAVVAIDTLNRSLFGSESSDEDMSLYVRAADAVRDAFDCVVPVIHHCGHNGDRPRGHSSLLGAADVLIAVKRDAADNIVSTVEDTKDGVKGLEIVSRLVPVELGPDDDGDEMTSCVIEPVEGSAPKREKWPKALVIFKRTFDAAPGSVGRKMFPFADGPEVLAVTREAVRAEFMKAYPADNPKAKAEAFRRCERDALARGLMASRSLGQDEAAETYFWLGGRP
jgi:hypothetical protein